ncbi:MAG: hypothetical protein OEX83_00250, partial [Gammaproteobacteria bacterium]|nr:hypothetical protein [Gammaproteobacteria bacterium]
MNTSYMLHKGIEEVRMIRKLVLITAMLMVFLTTNVMALGLGELTLHSSLNEPLSAEIELLSVQADELDGIKVAMASQRDFELVGVERMYFLTSLDFATKINEAGKAVISITTKDPIKEPFLDFVIEVNWSKGRMLREYTTLVDPPAFTQEAPAPVKQAETKSKQSVVRTSEPAPTPAEQPVAAEEEPLFPNIAIEEDKSVPDTYGATKRTDTLWSIAQSVRPSSKVSTDQVMQALLKKNPEAFYNNNINELKAGHVLRIPDVEEITAISKREAHQLSRTQYQDWKTARSKSTHIDTSAPGEGGLMAPDMVNSSEEAGPRLKLLSPDEEAALMSQTEENQAGSGSAMQDGGTGVTSEESEALRARVSELESQLNEMEKALAIKDDALAGFQKEMQVTPAITAQPLQKPETETVTKTEPEKPKTVPAVKPKPAPAPSSAS